MKAISAPFSSEKQGEFVNKNAFCNLVMLSERTVAVLAVGVVLHSRL